jgi:N-acetylglucosamine kinase-like BadF-type ATPase
MARRSLVLGIDGGTQKSTGMLSDDLGVILARREGAAMNVNATGFDNVARALFILVTRCCEDARCKPADLSSAVVGITGLEREMDRSRTREAVNALFVKDGARPLPVAFESDARTALEGAFDGADGVVVVAAADSIVIGKTPRGEVVSVGGWGRILGDEGSGYSIGREALVAVARESEKRGTAGRLREVLAQRYHFNSREQIISAIYNDKFDIASLAPTVMETAADNDIVAQRILDRAAMQLAEQARVIVMQMGLLRKVKLVMVGNLVDRETVYANVLHMKLLKMLPQVEIRPPLHEPAYGAVLMALGRLRKA